MKIASEECARNRDKDWLTLKEFVTTYALLLKEFRIVTTAETKSQIAAAAKQSLDIDAVGSGFEATVKISSMLATDDLTRLLIFDDPSDTSVKKPENYALIRNVNLHGHQLHLNGSSAALWADQEHASRGIGPPVRDYDLRPQMILVSPTDDDPPYRDDFFEDGRKKKIIKESIVLIAHDSEKRRIARFVQHHLSVLKRFRRITGTSDTVRAIYEHLKEHVEPTRRPLMVLTGATDAQSPGPSGGDVVIADEIIATFRRISQEYKDKNDPQRQIRDRVMFHVFFFADYKQVPQVHLADIQVLIKTCLNPKNRVNLIMNSRTAEEWAERYRHLA
ncbi:MAG: hypothetical protein ACU0DI_11050 [Paracoccaceae bacterium]